MSAYKKGEFEISTDKNRLQLNTIHEYLKEAYWCKNIPMETMVKSIEHSYCFGLYHQEKQIGFARVITDYATYGYLADVFVLQPYRGKGLSKWLLQAIIKHPELQGFRKWVLGTRDAHGLYAKYAGFTPLKTPEKFMELHFPDRYK